MLSILALVSLVNVGSLGFYGFGITYKLITIVGQTTWAEATQFVPYLLANIGDLLCSIVFWLVVCVAIVSAWLIKRLSSKIFFPVVMVASVMGLFTFDWISRDLPNNRIIALMSVRISRLMKESIEDQRRLREFAEKMHELPYVDDLRCEGLATNVVVVIGESSNRQHNSIYGFALPTTPRLEAERNNLFLFSQAVAPATNTAASLERILTFKKDDRKDGDWYTYPNVVDLFHNCGYTTYWYSNQNQGGLYMDSSAAIATHADEAKYVGVTSSSDMQWYYDELLLPCLDKAFADDGASRKLIFLHLMGSHTGYMARYPEKYSRFTVQEVTENMPKPWMNTSKAKVLSEYLNSIYYTDYILGEILNKVKESPNPSLMLYLSDHGEAVYDEDDYVGRDKKHVEVPFILYMNDAYRRRNPEMVETVREALDRPFSTANTIHSLITLTGTEYPLYEEAEDVLSPKFRPRKRYVDRELWPYEESALPVPAR